MPDHNTQQTLDALIMQSTSPGWSLPSSTTPGGESGYEPWYPTNMDTDSSVKRLITRFFEVSDDQDRNEEWIDFFHDNATVMMGKDFAKGKDEIRQLRQRMWKDVEARKHRLCKVFPASFSSKRLEIALMHEAEYMMSGNVAYRMRDGKGEAVAGFAGHAQLWRGSETAPWKFQFYRVYVQK